MNARLLWAGQNTIAAFLLAVLVFVVTRAWRHPPVVHLLWLLVLLKLVAPPIVPVSWPGVAPPAAAHFDQASSVVADSSSNNNINDTGNEFVADEIVVHEPAVPMHAAIPIAGVKPLVVEDQGATWSLAARRAIVALWLGGAAVCGLVAVLRIVRFERLLRDTLPASRRTEQLTTEIAARLGVRRVPTVRYVQFADIPMLWCAGMRPTIVLPLGLVSEINDDHLALILAHELVHLRRRDHWVRFIELIVITLYWWNPMVRMIRRQIHQAEDQCCDACVRWAFPDQTHRYAEVIFETADRLRWSRSGRPPALASPFFQSASLKARIEMILHGQFAPKLYRKSKLLFALLALVVIPSAALSAKDEGRTDAIADSATTPAAGLEFPHVVQFEQGATRFADGDKITITEIRGTADTLLPGNIYRIKGTYTLGSHDRATLAAYTTARESKDGTSTSYRVQTTLVDKGTGTFTLFLPMNCRGWPHVSFYPTEGGNDFGGNYFGTGESTLKQWWGTKDSNQTEATSSTTASESKTTDREPTKITLTSPQVKAVTLTQPFVAKIHAQRHIKIRSLEKGYLEAIPVKEGQAVKAGEMMFQVIPILYQKKADAENAEAKLAQLDLNNTQKQFEDKVVSKNEVDLRKIKLDKAQAQADLAKAELNFATVRAPFDGIIDRLQCQQGSLVLEGDILTTLSDNSVMWAYFNVPEARYLEYMQDPHKAELKIELRLANGEKFNPVGKLGAIEADFNSEAGNVPFRADFPNPESLLRHGQGGTVLISRVLNDALVIPQRATFEALGKRYVYVVDKENVAHQREIHYSNEMDDIFVIKTGTIGPDEKIVLDGVRQVRDGEKVKLDVN